MEPVHNLRFRWNDHVPHLSKVFSEQRLDEQYCNVTIVSEDGYIFKAHSIILSMTSGYFERILHDIDPDQQPIIVLHGANYKELSCVMAYIYEGTTRVDHCLMESVLDLADMLEIKGLSKMKNNLSIKKLIAPSNHHSNISLPKTINPIASLSQTSDSQILKVDSEVKQVRENDLSMKDIRERLDKKLENIDLEEDTENSMDQTLGIDLSLSKNSASVSEIMNKDFGRNFNLPEESPLNKRKNILDNSEDFQNATCDPDFGKMGDKIENIVPYKKKRFGTSLGVDEDCINSKTRCSSAPLFSKSSGKANDKMRPASRVETGNEVKEKQAYSYFSAYDTDEDSDGLKQKLISSWNSSMSSGRPSRVSSPIECCNDDTNIMKAEIYKKNLIGSFDIGLNSIKNRPQFKGMDTDNSSEAKDQPNKLSDPSYILPNNTFPSEIAADYLSDIDDLPIDKYEHTDSPRQDSGQSVFRPVSVGRPIYARSDVSYSVSSSPADFISSNSTTNRFIRLVPFDPSRGCPVSNSGEFNKNFIYGLNPPTSFVKIRNNQSYVPDNIANAPEKPQKSSIVMSTAHIGNLDSDSCFSASKTTQLPLFHNLYSNNKPSRYSLDSTRDTESLPPISLADYADVNVTNYRPAASDQQSSAYNERVKKVFDLMEYKKPKSLVKRPMNMYTLYMKSMLPSISSQYPNYLNKEKIALISQMWNSLSSCDRKIWEEKAKKVRSEFAEANPDYVFNPSDIRLQHEEHKLKKAAKNYLFLAKS